MILEAKAVCYHYKRHKEQVLNKVSASFETGRFYAIVGASGSGKTTLLSLLAGLDVPTAGMICYDGVDIQKTGLNNHRRRQVALIFQSYNLIDYLTAEENVRLGGACDAGALLGEVGLASACGNRSVLQLSGGQQQRVAIARALASEAKVILADEPTGNLDSATADDIIRLLTRTAHDGGRSVIAVTHSERLAAAADRVLHLEDGKLRE